jgi:lipoyl synthase
LLGKYLQELSNPKSQFLPKQIRVSSGTAIVLGLLEGKLDAAPTTAYLMTYKIGKCSANCGFCPQARSSQSKAELLSRVSWPAFAVSSVVEQIGNAFRVGKIKRVCIQTLNYPKVFEELSGFIKVLKSQVDVPVSASCQPSNSQDMWDLYQAGANRIGIAVDTATEKLFNKVKGETAGGLYKWENEFVMLRTAIGIFGEGNVSTHLIVGLGETEKEAISLLQTFVNIGVTPGLFAFTPVRGTAFAGNPQPRLEVYRRVQLARYLIVNAVAKFENMIFSEEGTLMDFGVESANLAQIVQSGEPFLTSGCPECNRPFYNEKPSGPFYNFPRKLNSYETSEIIEQLANYLD